MTCVVGIGSDGGPADGPGPGKPLKSESSTVLSPYVGAPAGRCMVGGFEPPLADGSPSFDVPNDDADKLSGTCKTTPQVGHLTRIPTDSSRTRNGL